jgi:hypothetical protein
MICSENSIGLRKINISEMLWNLYHNGQLDFAVSKHTQINILNPTTLQPYHGNVCLVPQFFGPVVED